MDVASSNSCFPDIMDVLHKDMVIYKQDMRYKWGVNGNVIGSFASDIPLEDDSLDYMTLHCSFEHFEGGEDFKFFAEADRLLKVGVVCIIPLYMADEYTIVTSPSVWLNKSKVYSEPPVLDKRAKIIIDDSISQRQSKHFSVEILYEELLVKYKGYYDITVVFIENYSDFKGAYPFALLLKKCSEL